MPTVPVYDQQRVQTAPIPGARLTTQADPQAFGQGVGQALQHVGQTVAGVHLQELEKANQVRMLDFDAQVSQFENDHVYGKALRTEGKDSFGIREQFDKDWTGLADNLNRQTSNDQQRMAVHKMLTERKISNDRMLIRHMDGEGRKYEDEALKATIGSSVNRAAVSADPGEIMVPGATRDHNVDLQIAKQEEEISKYGARRGMPPEWVKAQIEQHRTATISGVVQQMLATDQPDAASAYLKAYRGDISGPDATRLDSEVARKTASSAERRYADDITMKANSRADVEGLLKSVPDQHVEAVRARVEHHFAWKDQAEAEDNRNTYRELSKAVDGGAQVADLPAEKTDKIYPEQKPILLALQRNKAMGIEPVQNEAADKQFTRAIAVPLAEFATLTPEQIDAYRATQDKHHFEQLRDRYKVAKDAVTGSKGKAAAMSVETFDRTFETEMRSAALIPLNQHVAKLEGDDLARYLRTREVAQMAVEAEQAKTGVPLGTAEIKKIVTDSLTGVIAIDTPGWFSVKPKPQIAGSVLTREEAKAYAPLETIDDAVKQHWKQWAQNSGLPKLTDTKLSRVIALTRMGADKQKILAVLQDPTIQYKNAENTGGAGGSWEPDTAPSPAAASASGPASTATSMEPPMDTRRRNVAAKMAPAGESTSMEPPMDTWLRNVAAKMAPAGESTPMEPPMDTWRRNMSESDKWKYLFGTPKEQR